MILLIKVVEIQIVLVVVVDLNLVRVDLGNVIKILVCVNN